MLVASILAASVLAASVLVASVLEMSSPPACAACGAEPGISVTCSTEFVVESVILTVVVSEFVPGTADVTVFSGAVVAESEEAVIAVVDGVIVLGLVVDVGETVVDGAIVVAEFETVVAVVDGGLVDPTGKAVGALVAT